MLPDFLPSNPFRSPNWRWDAAGNLSGPIKASASKDPWLKKAIRFRLQLKKSKSDAEQTKLALRFEDIYWAWRIWDAVDDERHRLLRHELEARILAEDTEERINKLCGITPEVQEAYVKIFFDVRDRLSQPAYIMHQVLGPKVHSGMTERDYELLWKMFGYCAGPMAVDAIINTMSGLEKPKTKQEIHGFLTSVAQLAIRRKAVIAAHTIRPSDFTSADIIEKFLRLVEMERQQLAESSGDSLEDAASAVLQSLAQGFSSGLSIESEGDRLLEPYDRSAVELKYDEMMQVTNEKDPPNLDVIDVEFPDPPSKDEK